MDEKVIVNGTNVVRVDSEELAQNQEQPRRKRSMTLVKLGWLAERVRKCERIKQQIEAGTYHVDAHDVAESILGMDLAKRAREE